MGTTYYDKANTDKHIIEMASRIADPHQQARRKVILFSEHHTESKANLLGHIARADHHDPIKQITFQKTRAAASNMASKEQ